jgi:DNA-binding CsgD family transcriptional regulator
LSGERQAARALLERYLPALREPQALRGPGDLVALMAHSFLWLEEYDTARDLYDRVVTAARAASAPAALPYALTGRSELAFRTGRWPAATADAAEAIELSDELGQPAVTGWALSCLANVEAGRGDANACRTHLARANALVTRTGASAGHTYIGAALGLLELGLGRLDAAVTALEPVAHLTKVNGMREPHVVQWAPDLVEALARSGRHHEAVCALESFDEQARHTRGAWALAAAARCHGLLTVDEDFERWFEQALDLHQGLPAPFERARTEQCYGERLRRAGRRTRARTPLRSAHAAFDALGAAPWSERAHAELRATGETVRRRRRSAADHLTPQEIQVALLVAGGATNREAAGALFVTPKTIEFHLGRIYRKLGIHSRTQLSVRLSRGDPVSGVAGDA